MKNNSILVLLSISCLLSSSPLYAQEGAPSPSTSRVSDLMELPLEELMKMDISSAGLVKQSLSTAPATMYVYREEDFKKYGFRDLKDILKFTPGIEYTDDSNWSQGGQRGFPGNWAQTKLLVDGRDVNLIFSGEAFISAQYPLYSLEQVEIVQGPASALYGADAFVGVINLITKKAAQGTSKGEIFQHLGSIESTGDNASTAVTFSTGGDNLSVAAHAYTFRGEGVDYSDFAKEEKFSIVNREERVSALNEGRGDVRNDDKAQVAGVELAYDLKSYGKLSMGSELRNVSSYGSQGYPNVTLNGYDKREQISSHLTYDIPGSGAFFKGAQVTYQNLFDDTLINYIVGFKDNSGPRGYYNVNDSFLHTLRAQSEFALPSLNNSLVLGSRYRVIDVAVPTFNSVSQTSVNPYVDQKEYSLYFEDAQKLIGDRLIVTTGYRYDHNDGYGGVNTFRGSLVGKVSDAFTAKAIFGQAFRQPTIFERERRPDVDPSLMETKELVLQYSKGGHYAHVSYFWNDAKDLLVELSQKSGEVPVFGNLGTQWSRGVETYYRGSVGNLYGTAWYTYTEVPHDENISLHKVGGSLGYTFTRQWSVNLLTKWASSVKEQESVRPAEASPYGKKVNDFFQTNLNIVGSKISVSDKLPSLDLTFSVRNLFDRENYLPNFRGPTPVQFLDEGRTYWLMASIPF